MKRIISLLTICLFLLPAIWATDANATGLGIYFPYAAGRANFDYYEADSYNFGIGFVLDGNVANNRVFSYRLNIGFEYFEHKYEREYYDYHYGYHYYHYTREGFRIVTDHTFGFGVLRTRVVRLWLGPMVRVGFISEDGEPGLTVGAGLTILGLNLNFGRIFTLGLEGGYRFTGNFYFEDIYEEDYYYDYDDPVDASADNEFYAKLSIIFRIGDVYEQYSRGRYKY